MTQPSKKGAAQGATEALVRLMELVARLRAPDGCPWDRKQTPASVAPYILEEAFEAVEAVEASDPGEALGELGDLLFQVVFMAHLYAEKGEFGLARVMDQVTEKMTRRHPHVFGEKKLDNAEEVKGLWGEIKKQERAGSRAGLLDSVPKSAPALVRAHRLGQRAARVDFDWPDAAGVWDKVQEELAELNDAPDTRRTEEEFGDLLFSLVQWARHKGIGSEAALRKANTRFQQRFTAMEELARRRGRDLESLDMAALDALWEEIKAAD